MNILTFILLTCVLACVTSDCTITKDSVQNSNRIFLYRDDHGAFQLQRVDIVPNDGTLYMYCNDEDVLETKCQDDGQFWPPLPMSCEFPVQPKPVESSDAVCPATLYSVGYQIAGKQLELFRSCYDAKNGQVLYAQSDVYHKRYFAKRPQVDFLTDQLVTAQFASSYMKRNIYDRFISIFGSTQAYLSNPNDLVINRGHLVGSADFLFRDQMASTFRFINMVPQFKTINDGNWEKIERWIRGQIPVTHPLNIKTGAIGVLRLPDRNEDYHSVTLYGSQLPIPQWIYKIVRDNQGRRLYVFLSFNNIFQTERPRVYDKCRPVDCPLSLPDRAQDGFIFCCDPNSFPY